jgi:hypothetical protein
MLVSDGPRNHSVKTSEHTTSTRTPEGWGLESRYGGHGQVTLLDHCPLTCSYLIIAIL